MIDHTNKTTAIQRANKTSKSGWERDPVMMLTLEKTLQGGVLSQDGEF